MNLRSLYEEHLQLVSQHTEKALALAAEFEADYDGIVFHAGKQDLYHADDQHVFFHSVAHFVRFAPVPGPDHLLLFQPGARPKLFRVVPDDFWYETPTKIDHPCMDVLEIVQVGSGQEAIAQIGNVSRFAYVGNAPRVAASLGIALPCIEPKTLVSALDWYRGIKTPYEVECMRQATRSAALGHRAVRDGFARRESERQLHASYLEAVGLLDMQTPYENIIAWDDRAATLHYQTKRVSEPDPGNVLLIDAGSVTHGYASDVTRTYAHDGVHPVFRSMLDRMEEMQKELVSRMGPGRSYIDIHVRAHRGVAEILCDLGVLKTTADDALERQLTQPFFPHGVGHHLGIQVHDVAGHQITPKGDRQAPPEGYPFLRTTRELAAGHVLTIEPGLYFIPMLLEPLRSSEKASACNWDLIDALTPCGGIRIEDNVLVTQDGYENLTRPHIPGHLV